MSIRFLAAMILIPINCIIIFRKPFWGVVLLALAYFIRPELWGASEFMKPIFIFTACTGISLILNKSGSQQKWRVPINLILLGLMLLAMVFSSVSAVVSREAAYHNNMVIFKLLILILIIVNLVDDLKKLNIAFWAIVAGCGWLVKATLFHYFIEGAHRANPMGGQGGGGNSLGTALVMTLPFLFYKLTSGKKWERILSLLAIPLWLVSIIAISSRGVFLGLLVVFFLMVIVSKRKFAVTVLVLFAVIFFFAQATPFFWGRMDKIVNYRGDASAETRLKLWKAGIQMYRDYPMAGVGPNNFRYLSPTYTGLTFQSPEGGGFIAHNTYIELLAETGIQGLIFYVFAIFATLLGVMKIKKSSIKNSIAIYDKSEIILFSNVFIIAIIAFSIRSITGTTIRQDVFYWFLALSSALIYNANNIYKKMKQNTLSDS